MIDNQMIDNYSLTHRNVYIGIWKIQYQIKGLNSKESAEEVPQSQITQPINSKRKIAEEVPQSQITQPINSKRKTKLENAFALHTNIFFLHWKFMFCL